MDAIHSKDLKKIASFFCCDQDLVHLKPIKKEDHSESSLITVNKKKFFLKKFYKKEDPFKLDIKKETNLHRVLSPFSLTSKLIFYDFDHKIFICDWIEDQKYEVTEDCLTDHLVTSIIKKNNLALFDGLPRRKLTEITMYYYSLYSQLFIFSEISHIIKIFSELGILLDSSATKFVISHGDLNFSNCLLNDDELVFCDWEYACIGSPFLDIASVIVHEKLSQEDAYIFATSILSGLEPKINIDDLNLWVQFTLIMNGLWSILYDKEVVMEKLVQDL